MLLDGAKNRDAILRKLIYGVSYDNVWVHELSLEQRAKINRPDLLAYLDLLNEAGYISPHPANNKGILNSSAPLPSWCITSKGKVFLLEDGGYTGVFISDNRDKMRAETNEKWMVRGSLGAAIFAFLILVYYVLSFLYEHQLWFFSEKCS